MVLTALVISPTPGMAAGDDRPGTRSEDDDPQLTAVALVAMLNQFCYLLLTSRASRAEPDDQACFDTLAKIFYRAIYYKEAS